MMNWKGSLLVAVICAFLSFCALNGQSAKMVADIPFEFYIGETLLPPGTYSFRTNLHIPDRVLEVSGENHKLYQIFITARPASGRWVSEVVFNKYSDGSHFLGAVRIPGDPVRKMPRSDYEEEIITTDWSVEQIALALRPSRFGGEK